jgi:GDPmannose 4,6-dehydratase
VSECKLKKTAIVTGISGQDGAYLAKHLLGEGYKVYGATRRSSRTSQTLPRLQRLGIEGEVELIDFELAENSNICRVIKKLQVDEFYNLAAQSFVGTSWEQPLSTNDTNGTGVLRILEAIREYSPQTRFYQASTSEMFGAAPAPQNEDTAFYPRSPYGVSKLFGHWITKNYRESHALKACSGILFNHESPLRGQEFVTRKITLGLVRVSLGKQSCLELGNLDAQRDWGFAGDYVRGMHLMLNAAEPTDYVLATGQTHTIREFVTMAGKLLNLDIQWQGSGESEIGIDASTNKPVVTISQRYYRPAEVDLLLGDPTKAEAQLGWKREVNFEGLVEMMVAADYDALKSGNLTL